jgi:hypothetical protein
MARRPTAVHARAYAPGDEQQLRAGLREVISTDRSDEEWRWWFLKNPCGQATIFVLETEGTIVGHQSHVPGEMWVDGRRLHVGIGGDSWVKRGFQGPGGMRRLVEAFLASDHGLDVRINYPGERSAKIFERLGLGTVVGEASIWARAHNRSFFARQSPAAVLPLTLTARGASAVASAGPDRVRVEPLRDIGSEIDDLARDSAEFARCIRIRDADYLRWRWAEQPGGRWTIRAARRRDDTLSGWIVYGRDSGSSRGLIGDLLAGDARSARALLLEASRSLRREGCSGVWLMLHDPRPWASRALLRAGFLPTRRGILVMVGTLGDRAGTAPGSLANWYLTLGDTDNSAGTAAGEIGTSAQMGTAMPPGLVLS